MKEPTNSSAAGSDVSANDTPDFGGTRAQPAWDAPLDDYGRGYFNILAAE
jgi:hypothetical protein